MTGYPEILTDPSYRGQIVVLTYPHAGNYGMPHGDAESPRVQVSALVVRELCRERSGARPADELDAVLRAAGILGIEGIDTRALTRRLRQQGALRGVVAAAPAGAVGDGADWARSLVERARALPHMEGSQLTTAVTLERPEVLRPGGGAPRARLTALHFGAKRSILAHFVRAGCEVTVLPADASAEQVEATHPDGILLSNGPGDPAACTRAIQTTRALLGAVPIFGICLGHQILGLAAGARTYKLSFGHHGANHPVRDERTGAVQITSQNHGFAIEEASLAHTGFHVSHRSLFDRTVEGIASDERRAWAVQYHPEAAPGPHDATPLMDAFLTRLDGR
jgi:carbamoyl-phosphate synthase small subunit